MQKNLPRMSGQPYKKDGWIVLRIQLYTHGTRYYWGDTVADGATLAAITGHTGFPERDYDKVLQQVAEYGYGLQEPVEE